MKLDEKENTFIQCQDCGELYEVPYEISIERSIVRMECPQCGGHVGLNCGSNRNDVALYINSYVDPRYY